MADGATAADVGEPRARFIDDYEVLLLDMGGTFMFGLDRFGDGEDYHATYRNLGGAALPPQAIRSWVTDVYDRMLTATGDPSRVDDFGDVGRFLADGDLAGGLPSEEVALLVEVFAQHEVGTVPQGHAEALQLLGASHPIGLVSNVWSSGAVFEAELKRAGVLDLFEVRVWSSDSRSIKPSPRLFQRALDAFGVEAERALFVGDNPNRDIAGAKALGMGTVWIENDLRPLTAATPDPDLIISDLTELPTAGRGRRGAGAMSGAES